ncbi:importin beta-like SAD2-like protein isoform X1 [Iris pallida]|uniref:Importin beta-like SAD2-like protein isoform X1 n=1 Tax=Iris pallida TaxID=29817 RepID=A0AAX6E1G4_IRIPA|nr:importin beta-like SAD2-like protein isoform X1 [Iris pallida]
MYFLNPTVPKEAVQSQLELIAKDILVPLLAMFHHFVDKALSYQDGTQTENWQVLLIICKCMYFTVRSYMPSAISPLLPSFCGDLFRILDSLSLNIVAPEGGYLLRLKTAKRTLRIICALVTRYRKHFDRLMPSFVTSAFRIARKSPDISIKLEWYRVQASYGSCSSYGLPCSVD